MNGRPLTKEQRERLILKVVLAVVLVGGLVFFGIVPLVRERARLRKELNDCEDGIAKAERLLRREGRIVPGLNRDLAALTNVLARAVPPEDNAFLWATEQIYQQARAAGVEVVSIAETKTPIPDWAKPPVETKPAADESPPEGRVGLSREQMEAMKAEKAAHLRHFAPYAVQFGAKAGYGDFVALIRSMEQANPNVSLTTISIAAQEGTPEQQMVTVVFEWPRHIAVHEKALADLLSKRVTP